MLKVAMFSWFVMCVWVLYLLNFADQDMFKLVMQ